LLENQKSRDMPFKKGSGKEFSFEKNENPLSAE